MTVVQPLTLNVIQLHYHRASEFPACIAPGNFAARELVNRTHRACSASCTFIGGSYSRSSCPCTVASRLSTALCFSNEQPWRQASSCSSSCIICLNTKPSTLNLVLRFTRTQLDPKHQTRNSPASAVAVKGKVQSPGAREVCRLRSGQVNHAVVDPAVFDFNEVVFPWYFCFFLRAVV